MGYRIGEGLPRLTDERLLERPIPGSKSGTCFHSNDEFGGGSDSSRIGVRDMLSYQSLMPAGAGTPRYENPEE